MYLPETNVKKIKAMLCFSFSTITIELDHYVNKLCAIYLQTRSQLASQKHHCKTMATS